MSVNKLNYKPHKTELIYTEFNMLLSTNSFEYTLIRSFNNFK